MPKYGIHYIVLDEMSKKLASSSSVKEKNMAKCITTHRAAANLGAIGPDLLFWAPDFEFVDGLRNFIKPLIQLRETLKDIDEVVDAIKDGFDTLANLPKNIVLDNLKSSPNPFVSSTATRVASLDLFIIDAKKNIEANIDAIKSEILPAICLKGLGMDSGLEAFTLARSIFQGQFGSGNQIGKEEQDWYWFDMLHYRKTGDFAKRLIENAEASNNDELKAYAYSYVTHYVTDTVGHPFVNTISGSPFRMAAQRHAVIENYMDQYEWCQRYGKNIRNDMYGKLEFASYTISDELAELISNTLSEVYRDSDCARPRRYKKNDGFLSKDDIKIAYDFQKLALEFLGGSEVILKPIEPRADFDEILADFFNDIEFPSPPPLPTNSDGNISLENLSHQIEEWFQAIENWIKWGLDIAKELVDTIVDAITTAASIMQEAVVLTIELMLYAIECLMYTIYREIHQILVLSGVAYPEPDDVDLNNPLAKDHITTHKSGMNVHEKYPILKFPGQQHLDRKSFLDILKMDSTINYDFAPSANPLKFKDSEEPHTRNSFYPRNDATTPKVFIDDRTTSPFNDVIFRKFADAKTPEETRALYSSLNNGFGNAVDLSVYILSNSASTDVFCNWNLDGDRGYGYKTWDGIPFTCTNSENKGLIRASEVRIDNNFGTYAELDEYVVQNSQTWTTMSEDDATGKTIVDHEVYVEDKLRTNGFIAPIIFSEKNIPEKFTDPTFYMDTSRVPASSWAEMLPSRYKLVDSTVNSDNFFFVNGIDTTPCAGQRATMGMQKTINSVFEKDKTFKKLKINYLHNYSDLIWGDLSTISDVIEVIFSDYLYIHYLNKSIEDNDPVELLKIKITNPAQVAVMALLHKGMLEKKKLMISAHSQGSMITSSAILAFSTIGAEHKAYLKSSVKVLHLEPEVTKTIRSRIRQLLNEDKVENKKHLVYIMNSSDRPLGSDTLTNLFAQDFLLGPPSSITIESEVKNLKSLFSDMQENINVDNILKIGEALSSGSPSLKSIFDKFVNSDFRNQMNFDSNELLDAHQISNQLRIIENDLRTNKFRSDPMDDPTGLLSRSSNSPRHRSAVDVKNFIIS